MSAQPRTRRSSIRVENFRRRAQVVIWFKGGATCQVNVRCNGLVRSFDGDTGLYDVLQWAGWAQGLH